MFRFFIWNSLLRSFREQRPEYVDILSSERSAVCEMDGEDYQVGGSPPTHLLGYYQGVSGYGIGPLVSDNSNTGIEEMGEMGPDTAQASNLDGRTAGSNNHGVDRGSISIWAGDLDAYMDENFLRQAVAASGWSNDITRIKVVRDHYTGMHAGYGFLDAASPEAAQRVITTGSGMPIPGTNRCWRLNMGRNTATTISFGTESNIYVGNLEPSVTDYQLMTAFRPRYASVRHAKVVCNEYGQSKGFGFVRFSEPVEAERAVVEMNGFVFNAKPIRLSPATGRARGSMSSSSYVYTGRHQGNNIPYHRVPPHGSSTNKRPRQLMSPDDPSNTTLFIGGTANHVSEDLLWREFSTFGELQAVRVPLNKTNFAFVRFKSRNCAQRAKDEISRTHFVSLNPNKPVRVEWASEQIPTSKLPASNFIPNFYSNTGPNVYNSPNSNPIVNISPASGPGDGGTDLSVTQRALACEDENVKQVERSSQLPTAHEIGIARNFESKFRTEQARKSNKAVGNDQSTPVGGHSETEPPSKRAAVGRPEYAATTGLTPPSGGPVGAISSPAETSKADRDFAPHMENKDAIEETPAMQFSWLNNASTQAASNSHCQ